MFFNVKFSIVLIKNYSILKQRNNKNRLIFVLSCVKHLVLYYKEFGNGTQFYVPLENGIYIILMFLYIKQTVLQIDEFIKHLLFLFLIYSLYFENL